MDVSQILSYFGGSTQPVINIQQNSPEVFDLILSLQCGDSIISIFPSIIYLIGIALLIHHIITMNIRPQLYRRVGRELLLQIPWQEILIFMLIYQCIRIWLSTLVLLNTLFKYYQKQLSLICPWGIKSIESSNLNLSSFPMISKGLRDFVKIPFVVFYIITGIAPFNKFTNVSDMRGLHPLVQTILAPRVLKIVVCTLMSFIPFLALIKLKERRPLPQFMLWMGPMRRDRSELGASGYYLERPISDVAVSSSVPDVKKSSSCNDISILKLRSRWNRVNPNALQLSNYEVLSLLREIKGQQKKNSQSQLATITYETTKYLEDKPCAFQTAEKVQNYLKAFLQHQIQLSKAEKLMLVNNPPTTPLEIQLVVEESEERLSDEQVDHLLQITNNLFSQNIQKTTE